jgi:hypothetical protein
MEVDDKGDNSAGEDDAWPNTGVVYDDDDDDASLACGSGGGWVAAYCWIANDDEIGWVIGIDVVVNGVALNDESTNGTTNDVNASFILSQQCQYLFAK